jgi:hypothetical protein
LTLHLNSTGGLGNQLFQLAALIQAADKINVEKHIRYKSSGKTFRTFDSRILLESLGISLCSSRCKLIFPRKRYFQQERDFNIFEKIPDGTWMNGYFQDSEYNLYSRTKIIQAISSRFGDCCNSAHERGLKAVAIHVRIGDYALNRINFNFHGVLSGEYYEKAIKEVEIASGIDVIYIYSDTPDQARIKIEKAIRRINPLIRIESGKCKNNNLICELYQLGSYENLIMSNSSFSWWAGILRTRNITVGPTRWYRENSMQRVNPMIQEWIKVDGLFESEVEL